MSYVTAKMDFQAWMDKVDAILVSRIGMESADLADCCYADWYEDGCTPAQAARRAVKAMDGDDDY